MAAEARSDVHHRVPCCLLRLFDAAAEGLAPWSEFDAEAERWGVEARGPSREDLTALVEGSTCEIPTNEHRRLHQDAGDFVRSATGHVPSTWPPPARSPATSKSAPASGGRSSR